MVRKATFVVLISWLVLGVLPANAPVACDQCAVSTVLAAETSESTNGDEQLDPGIFVLVVVLISIVVATIMVLRQSKPGLPEGYDDDPDDGTSEDQETSSR